MEGEHAVDDQHENFIPAYKRNQMVFLGTIKKLKRNLAIALAVIIILTIFISLSLAQKAECRYRPTDIGVAKQVAKSDEVAKKTVTQDQSTIISQEEKQNLKKGDEEKQKKQIEAADGQIKKPTSTEMKQPKPKLPVLKKSKQPKMENSLNHLHPLIDFTKPDFSNNPKFLQVLQKDSSFNQEKIKIDGDRIQQIIEKSRQIGENKPDNQLEEKMYLAYNLATDPYNKQFLQAQYQINEAKYNLKQRKQQTPFCICVVGRNNEEYFNYQYDSIIRQNYSNYRIYFVDDHSDNKALELFEDYLQKLPKKYQQKTTIIKNDEIKLAMYNRHTTIKHNCKQGQLVLDLDSDDWLIGNQVLNILNHHFQDTKDLWLYYSNIISVSENKGIAHKPIDFYPADVLNQNSFREWGYFKTSQLRVFRFDLYDKIDQQDYMSGLGQFYSWNSDMFMQYSLMQLSCPKHCQKQDQFLYFYNYQLARQRPRITQEYQRMISLTAVPYKKLDSLTEKATRQSMGPDGYAVDMLSKVLKNMKKIEVPDLDNFDKNIKVCTIISMYLLEYFYQFEDYYRKSSYSNNPNFKFVNIATFEIEQEQIDEINKRNLYLKHHQKVKLPNKPLKPLSYLEIYELIQTQCKDFQYISFAKSQPKAGSLQKIGNILKQKEVWMIYDGKMNGYYANLIGIEKSFLTYAFKMQLQKQNVEILNKYYDFIMIGLLELGNGHALKMDMQNFFQSKFQGLIGINNNKYSRNRYLNYHPYKPLTTYNINDIQKAKTPNPIATLSDKAEQKPRQNLVDASKIQVQQKKKPMKPINKTQLLEQGSEIMNIYKVQQIKQLPFCILSVKNNPMKDKILESLQRQKYKNYHYVEITYDTEVYSQLKQLILSECEQNAVLMFIDNILEEGTLIKLNSVHQRFNVWATYSNSSSEVIQIVSFYYRIYEMLSTNDFQFNNIQYLEKGKYQVFSIGILEMVGGHLKNVNIQNSSFSLLKTDLRNVTSFERTPYTKVFKLSQDFVVDLKVELKRLDNLKNLTIKNQSLNFLSHQKMQIAIYCQQLIYLPKNHSIGDLEKIQLLQKFQSLQLQKVENTRFCVSVFSHNNIEQNRYKKVLLSIFQQQYEDYHIVFFDDNSDDETFEKTIQYAKQRNFPQERITYVKNIQRAFATYNIINAAFNFCHEKEVQLLVDGDDQVIGRQAFSLLNKVYQKSKILGKERWIVYSNFKSNLFTYGTSLLLNEVTTLLQKNNTRKNNHVIGPIRTWRVQLVRNIPMKYHQDAGRKWLDTLYDDAIQHCLVQLAGNERIEYVPQILYEYNKQHGNNDDSTRQKILHRHDVYNYILSLPRLSQMDSLDGSGKQSEISKQLEEDRQKIFTVM